MDLEIFEKLIAEQEVTLAKARALLATPGLDAGRQRDAKRAERLAKAALVTLETAWDFAVAALLALEDAEADF